MKTWQEDLSLFISKVYVRPNLPFVLVGGLEGHLWAFNNKGVTHTIEFPARPEISHIETLEDPNFILLAANTVLMLYNITTGERRQLLALDSKISCIACDELRERLYIGLWSSENNKKTLMAYSFNKPAGDEISRNGNEKPCEMLWGLETGDIVRSICLSEEPASPCILVGSENKTVLYIDPDGNILDKFLAPNRITKVRTYSKDGHTMVLVISDADELLILKLDEKKLQPCAAIPLGARPGNAFFCTLNGTDYLVAVTPRSIDVYRKKLDQFDLLWQGDGSKARIKLLYWWPEDGCNRFVVERQDDSTLACYEFADNRIEAMMEAILECESIQAKIFLGETLPTNERVYDAEYLPTKQTLFAVTGDSQLFEAKVDIKLSIPPTLKMCKTTSIYTFPGDRLRTLAILDDNNEVLIYLGGEKGIVYKYSTLHRSISSIPLPGGWIYDSVLVKLKNGPRLLVLCEQGIYVFDKNLAQVGCFKIPGDKFRCLHWDDVTNRMYLGSEAGLVYLLRSPLPVTSGTIWEHQSYEIISRSQGKIRNINSISTLGKRLVVIGTEDRSIYAIDLSGNLMWSYLFGQWVRDFDIIQKDGKDAFVVVIGRQKYLDFIDTESGKLIRRYEIPYEPRSVRIFKYDWYVGMVVTEIASNLHLYTLSPSKKTNILIDPLAFPSHSADTEKIKSLLTGRNIIASLTFLAALITFLANLAQVMELIASWWARLLGK